jgi:hypothetical protein
MVKASVRLSFRERLCRPESKALAEPASKNYPPERKRIRSVFTGSRSAERSRRGRLLFAPPVRARSAARASPGLLGIASSWLLAASAPARHLLGTCLAPTWHLLGTCFGAPLARCHLALPVYPSCLHWCWCACSGHLLLGAPTQRVKRHSEIRGGWLRKTGCGSHISHVRAAIRRIWRPAIWESKLASPYSAVHF